MKKYFTASKKQLRDLGSRMIFYYFVVSIGGFLWEVLIFLLMEGEFRKRGFYYGPWVPIYGIGAVLLYILLGRGPCPMLSLLPRRRHHASVHLRQSAWNFSAVFLASAGLGTGLELFVGWMLHRFWALRYWDYSSYFFNFHGYICFWSAFGFGLAGALWICLLAEPLAGLWLRLPEKIRENSNTLLLLLFLLDFTAALIRPNSGRGITFP